MKNGWYKVEYKKDVKIADDIFDDTMVYVENNVIVEGKDEFGIKCNKTIKVTEELENKLVPLGFA